MADNDSQQQLKSTKTNKKVDLATQLALLGAQKGLIETLWSHNTGSCAKSRSTTTTQTIIMDVILAVSTAQTIVIEVIIAVPTAQRIIVEIF